MPSSNKDALRVSLAEHVTLREFDGEWVLLDLEKGSYFGLNEAGGMILTHFAAGRSVGEVATLLFQEFEVDEAEALRDVLHLVDDLDKAQLVQVHS